MQAYIRMTYEGGVRVLGREDRVRIETKIKARFRRKSCYDDYLKLFWDDPRSTLWLCLEKEIGSIFHVLFIRAWRERHFAIERDEEKRFKSTTKGLNEIKKWHEKKEGVLKGSIPQSLTLT